MQWISDAGYTFLGELAGQFNVVAWWFSDLWVGTRSWIWPFRLLSEPFGKLSWYFYQACFKTYNFREEYIHVIDFLNDLWGLNGLNSLITWIWPDWPYLKNNPGLYIELKLAHLIPDYWTLTRDPWEWLLRWVAEHHFHLYRWLVDPIAKIKDWLNWEYYPIWRFFEDPKQAILDFLYDISFEAPRFIRAPVSWMKEKIARELGLSDSFWLDPWRTLWEIVSDWVDLHIVEAAGHFKRVGEHVLRYMWEGRV